MCSPSRACLMTGKRPSRHGVTLTLTEGDLWPDRRNAAAALRTALRMGADGEIPRGRLARSFVRSALRMGPKSGHEPELPPGIDTLATLLRSRGYHVAMKGKWHLSKPAGRRALGAGRSPSGSSATTASANGSRPTPAATPRPHNFGGGSAGASHEGWDEDYTRQMESWLSSRSLPEPFCLVFSLVNPHDVLGFPDSYVPGGYGRAGVPRPRRAPAAEHGRGPAREARRACAARGWAWTTTSARCRTCRPSRTTWTSTPTCTGSSIARSAAC